MSSWHFYSWREWACIGKGRAFCAGGDVADVVHAIRAGGWKARLDHFMKGYTLNYLMATYSKPQFFLFKMTLNVGDVRSVSIAAAAA
ncbi:hypothetical protein V6N11_056697 [Hibiscus sabdariffa]|uniref:3-hydroxyisobutyryl-CoA hydrolase n=1 Tax=Hibiscus sabdariffa TaxID=183260 RepID=A0ABR2T4K9_9ROSI